MHHPHSVFSAFVDAFNRRDLGALGETLDDDAWAEVLGSPLPRETGRDVILGTSLPYLLDLEARLAAELRVIDEEAWILLRADGGVGAIDTAIHVTPGADGIGSLQYTVAPHRPEELRRLGVACRLPTVADE